MRVEALTPGMHFRDNDIENGSFKVIEERLYIVYNNDKDFVAIVNDIGNGNGIVREVIVGKDAVNYVNEVLGAEKKIVSATEEANADKVEYAEKRTLGVWFETVGKDKFIVSAKVLIALENREEEVLYISNILDLYAKHRYSAEIEWEYDNAYLKINGISFPLKRVSDLICSEETNELFEYRAEEAEQIIKACISDIDRVYSRESVKNNIKFWV